MPARHFFNFVARKPEPYRRHWEPLGDSVQRGVSFWLQGVPLLKLQSLLQFRHHVSLQPGCPSCPSCFCWFSCCSAGQMGTAGLLGGAQGHRTSSSSGRDQEPSGTVRIFLGVGFGPFWPVLVSLDFVTYPLDRFPLWDG